jgi:ribosomal protein L40E
MFDPSLKVLAESFIYGLICRKCYHNNPTNRKTCRKCSWPDLRKQHRLK